MNQKLQELQQSLQAWTQAFGHAQDPYIVGLYEALEKGERLDFWQTLDPLEYLPNYIAVKTNTGLGTARLLAGIRNIIIFLPVALTWASVSEATKAFNEFVTQNTGTPANFLQFWQDGYGLLDKFWSIGSIAQIDFVIVGMVIVLTAIVAIMQSRGQAANQVSNRIFISARTSLALEINLALDEFKPVTSANVPADVAKAVKSLRAALASGQSIEKPYSRLNKNVSDAATLVKSSTSLLKTQLSSLQKEIAKAQKKLGN